MAFDNGVVFRFLIAALATWRVAFLLARERGPWDVIERIRRAMASGGAGAAFKCVKCLGFWLAVPFACFVRMEWPDVIVIWLALAGVTAFIDEWTRPPFEWQEGVDQGIGPGSSEPHRGEASDDRVRRIE